MNMALNKYNNLLTSGRWSTKDPKDAQILDLVGVAQKFADKTNKSSEKYNKDSSKGEPAYIKDLPHCIMKYPKGGMGNKTKDGK